MIDDPDFRPVAAALERRGFDPERAHRLSALVADRLYVDGSDLLVWEDGEVVARLPMAEVFPD